MKCRRSKVSDGADSQLMRDNGFGLKNVLFFTEQVSPSDAIATCQWLVACNYVILHDTERYFFRGKILFDFSHPKRWEFVNGGRKQLHERQRLTKLWKKVVMIIVLLGIWGSICQPGKKLPPWGKYVAVRSYHSMVVISKMRQVEPLRFAQTHCGMRDAKDTIPGHWKHATFQGEGCCQ